MRTLKKGWLLCFFLILPGHLPAQYDQEAFLSKTVIREEDHRSLYLSLDNQNLFWNNEFFNSIEYGYTLFGTLLNTSLQYFPLSNLAVEGGVHLLNYYGSSHFDRIMPLFRIHYQPIPQLHIIMGQLYGGLNHGFIEPLFKFDRFMEVPPETGLQLRYRSEYWNSDFYIDWTQLLVPGIVGANEAFTLGWTNEIKILDPDRTFNLNLPLQGLITHVGGPRDTLNKPVESLFNATFGAHALWKFNGFLQELGSMVYMALYTDLSAQKTQKFNEGYGFYPNIYGKTRWFNIYLGYWRGHQFISPLGNPVFSSVSNKYEDMAFAERELVIFKLYFNHCISDGLYIGARFENFLDVRGTLPDGKKTEFNYSYGVYITFNRDFFLTEINRYK